MAEPNGPGRRGKPDIFTSQDRQFDEKVSDLRGFYEGLDTDEKPKFRAWLERVKTLHEEGGQWSTQLYVRTEYDDCDENGEPLRYADVEFSPNTMLCDQSMGCGRRLRSASHFTVGKDSRNSNPPRWR